MRQIDLRSVLRGIPHPRDTNLLDPALEDRPGVMRSRACLGVELDRAGAEVREVEALDRSVVEGDVRRLRVVGRRDREAVVLTRDEDAAGPPLEHGVVRAPVPEREL